MANSEPIQGNADWHGWTRRQRPPRLERRCQFPDYEATRGFLERLETLSEEADIWPNLSFGRTYVNLTLFADEKTQALSDAALAFAARVDGLDTDPKG